MQSQRHRGIEEKLDRQTGRSSQKAREFLSPGRRFARSPFQIFLYTFVPLWVIFLFVISQGNLAFAQDPRSVDRGLAFLTKVQNSDGSFGAQNDIDGRVRITSISLLAFLSAGHAPDLGKYGSAVRAATDYLLRVSSAKVSASTTLAISFTLTQAAGVDDNPADQQRIHQLTAHFENETEIIPSAHDQASSWKTLQALIPQEQAKQGATPLSYSTLYRISVLTADLHLGEVSQRIEVILISRQRPDGSWEGSPGSTALAVLSLTATDRLMPIGD